MGWVTGMHIILQPPKCLHKITVTVWVKSTVYAITIDIVNYSTKPVVHVGVVLLNVLLYEFVVHIPTPKKKGEEKGQVDIHLIIHLNHK